MILTSLFYVIVLLPSVALAGKKNIDMGEQSSKSSSSVETNAKKAPRSSKEEPSSPKPSSNGSGTDSKPLFKRIDPQKYILGPGDHIDVNLWGSYDSFEQAVVSADGKLTLPTIGELYVSGLTLRQAEEHIKNNVKQFYNKNVHAGLALSSLRSFKVPVLGAVANPGHYEATLDTRVSDLLDSAGGLLPSASQRHIQVKSEIGLRIEADLIAYLRLGSVNGNPFLLEGDVVFVPSTLSAAIWILDETTPTEEPMRLYEIKDGMLLTELIKELGGVNPAWDLQHIHVVKSHRNGNVSERVDLQALVLGGDSQQDIALHHGDYLYLSRRTHIPYLNDYEEVVGVETPSMLQHSPSGQPAPRAPKRSSETMALDRARQNR